MSLSSLSTLQSPAGILNPESRIPHPLAKILHPTFNILLCYYVCFAQLIRLALCNKVFVEN